ncbi:FG-GAP repeat domain-containing protein [Pseudoalteromonas sp. T1lg75]|uniref:FG-GAP repeat domain-containing protein n=1 Tax=Pseudoalteromonas sp. T1lg75 TaxID=2077102 RepID=UPI000CF5DF89|nr:VCBS repeat-containing protein [Pseudoalteromonas sp. T1lg75]
MPKLKLLTSLCLFSTLISGCGGGGSNNETPPLSSNSAPKVRLSDISTDEGLSLSIKADATDADGDALTYTWSQTSGNELTYTVTGSELQLIAPEVNEDTNFTFEVSVSDGIASTTKSMTLSVRDIDLTQQEAYEQLSQLVSTIPDLEWHHFGDIDLGGDGDLDIIITRDMNNGTSQNATALIYDSKAGYTIKELNIAAVARRIVVSDFNKDNLDDIYLPNHGREWGANDEIGGNNSIWLQADNSDLISTGQFDHIADYTHGGCTLDFNNDGAVDIFDVNVYQQAPRLWLNDGQGNFNEQPNAYPEDLTAVTFTWCVAGDFNKDGFDDVIMGANSGNDLQDGGGNQVGNSHVFLAGNGTEFSYSANTSLIPTNIANPAGNDPEFGGAWAVATVGMEIINYNNDQCLDFISYTTDYLYQHHFQVWEGSCDGKFKNAFSHHSEKDTADEINVAGLGFAVRDINGDGLQDFYTYENHTPINDVTKEFVFIQTTDGNFSQTEFTKAIGYNLLPSHWLGLKWLE